MATPTFIAGASSPVGATASLTATVPATAQVGDLALLILMHSYRSPASVTAGWTKVDGGSSSTRPQIWQRTIQAGDPGSSVTMTFGGTEGPGVLYVGVYRGVSSVEWFGTDPSFSLTMTTLGSAKLVGAITVSGDNSGTAAGDAPLGWTSRLDVANKSGSLGYVSLAGVVADVDQEMAATVDATFTGLGSGISVHVDGVVLSSNSAPNAPILAAPADGSTIDLNGTQRFDWDFSDPNAGDTQSQYELRYRTVATTTWTTVGGSTPSTYRDFAAGTFAAGDYEWQVRTWDALGVDGPWSGSSFFTAATPTGVPTITDPISGGTVDTDPYVVAWSTAGGQDAYQVRVVADDGAGGADELTVLYDTGQVNNAAARTASVPFPDNGSYVHLQVRVYLAGLWSSWASHRVLVSYTPPPPPTLTPSADDAAGAVVVTYSTPTPGAGEPAVTYADIEVRDTTGRDKHRPAEGVRVATLQTPSGTFIDWLPAAGINYEYRVTAVGDNGTTSASAWTPIDAEAAASVYYATY